MPSSRRTLRRRKHPREGHGPPLQTAENDAADREVRNVKFVRRGGIHPARATLRRRKRPGRIWNPPLQWVLRRAGIRPSHVAGRCRKACRGGACPSRKSRAAANTHGRDKSLPYEPRRARGQTGNHNLRVITNPCRGRCLHRPGQPRRAANAPGGYGIRPYNGFSAGRASGLPV